ncbi:MAG: tetratricopeptide repeat protein [Chitinophagales bacterium]
MQRIEQLKSMLESHPADNFLQHAMALEYIKIGNDKEARKLFEQILKQDPDYLGTYYHLAKLLERSGEIELALQWYQKGMESSRRLGDQHAYQELQAAFEGLQE